jgi:pimeloyl-ACP methyl ester carboxylesterase
LLAPIPSFYTDRSADNLDAILYVSKLVAEACQRSPVTKFIDTEQTVRDMDLIRILLGDEKLSYLGYSYGSWLGAWYTKLFPKNVGNFVLDSNTDFSSEFSRTFELQPASFQRAFDSVVVPYLVRNNLFFELGDTEAAVRDVYATLPEEIKFAVTFYLVGNLYSSFNIQDIGILLSAARGLNAVYQEDTSLVQNDFSTFLQKVLEHRYNTDDFINSLAVDWALSMAFDLEFYLDRANWMYSIALSDFSSVFTSILCNDGAWNKDTAYWIQKGNEENTNNPLIGGNLTDQPCVFWKNPTTQMPATPDNMPAVLMVQSEFDGPTNTDSALTAFESLPNAKMLFVEGEYTHGIFPYGTACVDVPVAQFWLDGSLPSARRTNCEAVPLPGEEGLGIEALIAAQDREKTLEYQLHEVIRRNAIKPLGLREYRPIRPRQQ